MAAVHFIEDGQDSDDEDQYEFTEDDNESFDSQPLAAETSIRFRLHGASEEIFDQAKIKYSRGPRICERSERRYRQRDRELANAATGCIPLTEMFKCQSENSSVSTTFRLWISQCKTLRLY
jgi:hypothetical protein